MRRQILKARVYEFILTLARFIDGAPPVPKKTFTNETGNTSIALSYPRYLMSN